jgi:hypothetical protein
MKFTFMILLVILFVLVGCGIEKNDKPVSKTEIKKEQITYQIPEYEVFEKIKRIDGNIHASVIIKSFNQETPLEQREKAAKAIAKKIDTTILDLYCTKEAFKANYSSSYLKEHPNALKKGYLGFLKNNKFKL